MTSFSAAARTKSHKGKRKRKTSTEVSHTRNAHPYACFNIVEQYSVSWLSRWGERDSERKSEKGNERRSSHKRRLTDLHASSSPS